jgi:hypothetical protein
VRAPIFQIHLNRKILGQSDLNTGRVFGKPHLDEPSSVFFLLVNPEADTEYRVTIGDAEELVPLDNDDPRQRNLYWQTNKYFQGCVGTVFVSVISFPRDGSSQARTRAVLPIGVRFDKIGKASYESMLDDIRDASLGIFDIVSRQTASIRFAKGPSPQGAANIELHFIQQVWKRIRLPLLQIREDPIIGIRRRNILSAHLPTDRLTYRGAALLAAKGVDLSLSQLPTGVRVPIQKPAATFDTPEHCVIVFVMQRLLLHLAHCQARIEDELNAFDKLRYRPYRERQIAKLHSKRQEASQLHKSMASIIRHPVFLDAKPADRILLTPVFKSVHHYRSFLRGILDAKQNRYWTLAEGLGESIKPVQKLYEHWVYLQLVAAFERSGFHLLSFHGLVRGSMEDRYVSDLEPGTTAEFRWLAGEKISISYEKHFPHQLEDSTVLHMDSRTGKTPDVVIEFWGLLRGVESVRYIAVVDAKYTNDPSEKVEAIEPYFNICSPITGGQISRQVWIAYPDIGQHSVDSREQAAWNTGAHGKPLQVKIHGKLPLMPPQRTQQPERASLEPCSQALNFVTDLLRFVRRAGIMPPASA